MFDKTRHYRLPEMQWDQAAAAEQSIQKIARSVVDQAEQLFRQPRYPLWTGDPGFAVYLWDCIQAQAKFPTVDVF